MTQQVTLPIHLQTFLTQFQQLYWNNLGIIDNEKAAEFFIDWIKSNIDISNEYIKVAWSYMYNRLKYPISEKVPDRILIDFFKWKLCEISRRRFAISSCSDDRKTQRQNHENFLKNVKDIKEIKKTLLPKDKPDILLTEQLFPMLNQFIMTVNECLCKSIY